MGLFNRLAKRSEDWFWREGVGPLRPGERRVNHTHLFQLTMESDLAGTLFLTDQRLIWRYAAANLDGFVREPFVYEPREVLQVVDTRDVNLGRFVVEVFHTAEQPKLSLIFRPFTDKKTGVMLCDRMYDDLVRVTEQWRESAKG